MPLLSGAPSAQEMGLSRKTVYAILSSLSVLSLALRYPASEHELGVDSFVIHGLVQVILDSQYAAWLLNPLSLFGLYPLSHPSGPMLVLADLSFVGGIQVEGSVLLLDFVVGFIGIMGSFVMAREIRAEVRFALLVAFVFALSPRFITTLVWQVPTRTFFTALMPWFVWSLLLFRRRPNPIQALLFVTILFLMLVSHRLAVIVVLVVAAFLVAMLFTSTMRLIRTLYPGTMFRASTRRIARMASWLLVLGIGAYFLVFSGALTAYQEGKLVDDTGVIAQIENLAVSLARSSGVLLPLAFIGIGVVIHSRNKDVQHPWAIAMFLALLPTLSLRQYTGAYIIPFAAIFVGLGLLWLFERLRGRTWLRRTAVSGVVAFAVISSAWIVAFDLSLLEPMEGGVYGGGLYMRYAGRETFVANSGILGAQLHAVSGRPYMPIGGATTAQQGPEVLAFGFLDPTRMRLSLIPLAKLTIEDDSFFSLDNVNLEQIWVELLTRPITDSQVREDIVTYRIQLYIEDRSYPASFVAFGNVYYSSFGASLQSERYFVYASPEFAAYYLGG